VAPPTAALKEPFVTALAVFIPAGDLETTSVWAPRLSVSMAARKPAAPLPMMRTSGLWVVMGVC